MNQNIPASDKFMDEEKFRTIIDIIKQNSQGNYEQHYEELAKQLRSLSPAEIILFYNRLRFYNEKSNTTELLRRNIYNSR